MEERVGSTDVKDRNSSSTPDEPPTSPLARFFRTVITRTESLINALKCSIRKDPTHQDVFSKLTVLRSALVVYIVAFIFSLIVTRTTFSGHCVGNVDYSSSLLGSPIYSPLGYSACESNTNVIRGSVSHCHCGNDERHPFLLLTEGGSRQQRKFDSNSRALNILGAVDTNYIRIYGEWFRIVTAITLHAGWMHLLNNVLLHCIVFYVIEPDWGLCRTLVGYFVTGCGGYLVGAVFIPCLRQVGSSGVHFGFLGAMIPYCVEHWHKMGSPTVILIMSMVVPMVDLAVKEKNIGLHIHLGSYLFGILYGFATIKSVTLFDGGALHQRLVLQLFSRWLSETSTTKWKRNVVKSSQIEEMDKLQYEQLAAAKANHWSFVKRLFGIYPLGPYRMRLRDIVTRAMSAILLVILLVLMIMLMYYEPLYIRLNSEVTSAFSSTCKCCYIKKNPENIILKLQVMYLEGKYFCFRSKDYADKYC
ncbi:Rhomboid-like protease 4 [Babesia sp. Xinjiang]|uniref:Rhomboid-like protease 4 n=1 Tax=Babesia sp. Xinjiang TaxID=462227 RepID=UPI000A2150CD|nr:Rhomboid-like protease 4 [Babesia sp. Xinjiang]ORM41765.1 Rhomboid-like protease 4 [Babesia sp. Xinjiang]